MIHSHDSPKPRGTDDETRRSTTIIDHVVQKDSYIQDRLNLFTVSDAYMHQKSLVSVLLYKVPQYT